MLDIHALHMAIAAVCPIEGVSIGVEEDKSTWRIDFLAAATPAQRKAAAAVVAAFDIAAPVYKRRGLSYGEFEALFTNDELDRVTAAAAGGNAQIFRWLLRASGAPKIDLDDASVVTGLDLLVSAHLLTTERRARVSAGMPPA